MSRSLQLIADELRQRITDQRLVVQFTRSRGPGGQNVNKVNTRVTVAINVPGEPALLAEEKRRIQDRYSTRITRDGWLRVASDTFRTQRANRNAATRRLFELMAAALLRRKPRRATAPTHGSVQKRLQEKKVRSLRKQLRRATDSD